MAKISIFGVLTNIQMLIYTLIHGGKVGKDINGNVYYRGKPRPGMQKERRWVVYKGAPEATTVPPEWHGWLHYQTDVVPANDSPYRKPWQKPPQQNLTGTDAAYLPPSLKGNGRDKATGDYVAWQPPK